MCRLANILWLIRIALGRRTPCSGQYIRFRSAARSGALPGRFPISAAGICVDWFEPCFLPEDQAPRLAIAVPGTIAADIFQMHGMQHAAAADPVGRIARFVGAPEHTKLFSAELKHLRHEGEFLQSSMAVQRGKNLFSATHLHTIRCSELGIVHLGHHLQAAVMHACCIRGRASSLNRSSRIAMPSEIGSPMTRNIWFQR